MKLNGRINQIQSNYSGNVFFNLDEAGGCGLWVWTSKYKSPTYICRHKETIHLFQFIDEETAEEWFGENKMNFDSIEKL